VLTICPFTEATDASPLVPTSFGYCPAETFACGRLRIDSRETHRQNGSRSGNDQRCRQSQSMSGASQGHIESPIVPKESRRYSGTAHERYYNNVRFAALRRIHRGDQHILAQRCLESLADQVYLGLIKSNNPDSISRSPCVVVQELFWPRHHSPGFQRSETLRGGRSLE
jgi:hypothetical protein